jgi:hypothetical protein
MKHNRHMGRLKRNRTADPLLEAAADAGKPPELNCRVDKSGQSQGSHTPPFAGSNPAPATFTPDEEREIDALVNSCGWHGPPRGRETAEEHHARHLEAAASWIATSAKDAAILREAARRTRQSIFAEV